MHNKKNILILASEITKGMKSLGPKCLLNINSIIAIIDYQINQLYANFTSPNIFISVGFEAEKVIKHVKSKHPNKKITFINNTGYIATNHGKNIIDYIESIGNKSNLLIISSGILFKDISILKNKNDSTILYIDNKKDNFELGSNKENTYVFYDLPVPWSECVVLCSDALSILENNKNKNIFYNMYLFEIINYLLENDIVFKDIICKKSQFLKINSTKDINKAKKFVSK
jgi:hypothetical protein